MPCRTDDYFDSRDYATPPAAPAIAKNMYDELKKEADKITKLLCSTMRIVEEGEYALLNDKLSKISGLSEWWVEHKEIDRKRIEKEVESASKVLSGLSPEARELLIQKLKG